MHFDTNVAIALLNGNQPRVRAEFDEAKIAGIPLGLSTIVYHELMYGAAYSAKRRANEEKIALFVAAGRFVLLPVTEADAAEAADIRAHLRATGTPIGPFDLLIAAQARRAKVPIVTANTSEFVRVPGLSVIDWAR